MKCWCCWLRSSQDGTKGTYLVPFTCPFWCGSESAAPPHQYNFAWSCRAWWRESDFRIKFHSRPWFWSLNKVPTLPALSYFHLGPWPVRSDDNQKPCVCKSFLLISRAYFSIFFIINFSLIYLLFSFMCIWCLYDNFWDELCENAEISFNDDQGIF